LVHIPIFENEKLTAVIEYAHSDSHFHITFYTVNEILNKISNLPDDKDYFNVIPKIQNWQILSDGSMYPMINDWISDYINTIPEDRIVSRNYSFSISTTYTIAVYVGTITLGDGSVVPYWAKWSQTVTEYYNVPCSGGSTGGGSFSTSVDIPPRETSDSVGGSGTSSNNTEDVIIIIENGFDFDEECKGNHMGTNAADLITAISKGPSCGNKDGDAIVNEIMEKLCEEANSSESGFHGPNGYITEDKVKAELANQYPGCPCNAAIIDYMKRNDADLTAEQLHNIVSEFEKNGNQGCDGTLSDDKIDDQILNILDYTGQDWFFDEEYWNDPTLTFPPQVEPSYQDFFDGFPQKDGKFIYGADEIYRIAGGDVLQVRKDDIADGGRDRTANTCALKVSIALNNAGIEIPDIKSTSDKPGTLEGKDGNFYFLNARALSEWMKKTFSDYDNAPDGYSNPSTSTLNTALDGRKGIGIGVNPAGSYTSGHADLFDGDRCSTTQPEMRCFGGYETVYYWELD